MSATPVFDPLQQQQPPPTVMDQQAYTSHAGHGSVGPVIGVLLVIAVLGAIAVMIGRVCSSRRIMGRHGRYDFESWVETKCASCIDGHVSAPRPRMVVAESSTTSTGSGDAGPAAVSEEAQQETKEEEIANQNQQPQQQHHHGERAEP